MLRSALAAAAALVLILGVVFVRQRMWPAAATANADSVLSPRPSPQPAVAQAGLLEQRQNVVSEIVDLEDGIGVLASSRPTPIWSKATTIKDADNAGRPL